MPRVSKNPIILDHLPSIRASHIIKTYGVPSQFNISLIRRQGENVQIVCSLEKKLGMTNAHFSIEKAGAKKFQSFRIERIPSNLNVGTVPLFACPISCRRSRKLFIFGNSILSAHQMKNWYYNSQLIPRSLRAIWPSIIKEVQIGTP